MNHHVSPKTQRDETVTLLRSAEVHSQDILLLGPQYHCLQDQVLLVSVRSKNAIEIKMMR